MKRSRDWTRQYLAAYDIRGHANKVAEADRQINKGRRRRGLSPLDTPPEAIISRGDQKGEVKRAWHDGDPRKGDRDTSGGTTIAGMRRRAGSGSAVAEMRADSDAQRNAEKAQRDAKRRARRNLERSGLVSPQQRRRTRKNPATAGIVGGSMNIAEVVRSVAADRRKSEAEVAGAAEAVTEAAADDAISLVELAEMLDNASREAAAANEYEAAEDAAIAAEVAALTALLSEAPVSDIPPTITTADLADALSYFPTVAGPGACTCQGGTTMMNQNPLSGLTGMSGGRRATADLASRILGGGIPQRGGSPKQSTVLPLVSGQSIPANTSQTLTITPLSDIEPGSVLWVNAYGLGTATPFAVTGVSVSGQNQLYGASGAGVSEEMVDVTNLQSPGIFIPARIPANNSFSVTVFNRDPTNPISIDVALTGTAVQLVQALQACGIR